MPTIARPPTSSGSSAATRLRKKSSESRNSNGNANSSARPQVALDLGVDLLLGEPPSRRRSLRVRRPASRRSARRRPGPRRRRSASARPRGTWSDRRERRRRGSGSRQLETAATSGSAPTRSASASTRRAPEAERGSTPPRQHDHARLAIAGGLEHGRRRSRSRSAGRRPRRGRAGSQRRPRRPRRARTARSAKIRIRLARRSASDASLVIIGRPAPRSASRGGRPRARTSRRRTHCQAIPNRSATWVELSGPAGLPASIARSSAATVRWWSRFASSVSAVAPGPPKSEKKTLSRPSSRVSWIWEGTPSQRRSASRPWSVRLNSIRFRLLVAIRAPLDQSGFREVAQLGVDLPVARRPEEPGRVVDEALDLVAASIGPRPSIPRITRAVGLSSIYLRDISRGYVSP